jgi:hypothetical protein
MFVNAGYLSAHNANIPSLNPGLGSGRKNRYIMHQGKDGLAFVEAFLAQKIYLRGVGRERERGGEVWAGSGPAEGGFPFFYFLFLSSIFYFFISFSFEQINS